ncbi:MAG: LytTR family DNA-binding domain-containing protein [Bacteroidota bacterium]
MNEKIKCLVVDDEPLAARLIGKHIQQILQLELVASCWNALEAFEILKREQIDLIFLDIQMPVLNGIEFVKSLPNPPSVIFTTAYRDYAVESYELEVVDYLLKPITFTRFFKSINKYLSRLEQKQSPVSVPVAKNTSPSETEDFIYVNTNRKYVKVLFREVLYIESLKDYVRIHTENQRITTKNKISELVEKLPNYFLRVHRSFVVNTRQISAYTVNNIEIGEAEIPIGGSYKKELMAFLKSR